MNKLLLLILFAIAALAAPEGNSKGPDLDADGEITEKEYNKWAMDGVRKEYEEAEPVKIRAKVVDEAGVPLGGAVVVAKFQHEVHEFSQEFHTKSNILGEASFIGRCSGVVPLYAKLDGYFSSSAKANVLTTVRVRDPKERMGWSNLKTWHDRDVTLVMKKKKAGIPMIALYQKGWGAPTNGEGIGIDLIKMDYVKPHGTGEVTDCVIKGEGSYVDEDKRQAKVTIVFPNAGDGIVALPSGKINEGPVTSSSEFLGLAEAPLEGYASTKTWTDAFPDTEINYFRIRSEIDTKGKVISAQYGKLYRADTYGFYWHEKKNTISCRHAIYVNATVNERNMVCNGVSLYEFDLNTESGRQEKELNESNLKP